VLLSFRIAQNTPIRADSLNFYDKVPLKIQRLGCGAIRRRRGAGGAAGDGAARARSSLRMSC